MYKKFGNVKNYFIFTLLLVSNKKEKVVIADNLILLEIC
jgi:hypothetical protein